MTTEIIILMIYKLKKHVYYTLKTTMIIIVTDTLYDKLNVKFLISLTEDCGFHE